VRNLARNPAIELKVVDPILRKGYRFNGGAVLHSDGETYEKDLGCSERAVTTRAASGSGRSWYSKSSAPRPLSRARTTRVRAKNRSQRSGSKGSHSDAVVGTQELRIQRGADQDEDRCRSAGAPGRTPPVWRDRPRSVPGRRSHEHQSARSARSPDCWFIHPGNAAMASCSCAYFRPFWAPARALAFT
jgi:hypothetical protein